MRRWSPLLWAFVWGLQVLLTGCRVEPPTVSTLTPSLSGFWNPNTQSFSSAEFRISETTATPWWGVVYFASIPELGGVVSQGSILTDATMYLTLSLARPIPVDIYAVTAQNARPSAAQMPRYVLTKVGSTTLQNTTAEQAISLKFQQPGYGGAVRIPDALQAAWRARNAGYVDPSSGVASPHMLTLVFRPQRVGSYSVTAPSSSIRLTTTEVEADYGVVGDQYIRDHTLMVGSGIVWDFKTGEPIAADEAVMDGYLTGQLVRAENWDPRDRGAGWKRRMWPRQRLPRQGGSGSR